MDNDSTRNGGPLSFADTLSPLERAALGLQASLSLFEVGKLTFPDNAKFQQSLVQTLISNAKMGNLPVYGNPDGWLDWIPTDASQPIGNAPLFPQCSAHLGSKSIVPPFVVSRNGETRIQAGAYGAEQVKNSGDNCLVSRADYFAFLKTPLALGIPSPDHWLPPPAESIPPESPLPLNERARRGLLVAETELPVWEILELEFPTKSSQQHGEYADWQETIETALRRGLLVSRPETRITQGETCLTGDWLIDRESYCRWRVTQPNPPAGSHIHKWLGATPALPESIPPVETSLPELPKRGIALVEAENAALVALRKALKREPDFEEFWDYLTTKDETGTVADSNDVGLQWIGHSEKSCSTAKSTIRNRLTAAKKRNPFTPS